ncbi:S-layer homology domain-containing protein [Symbiobacterium thermophilum]|nr:S-layer homology domain-containing protein [Symbiobacterium thermophilum]
MGLMKKLTSAVVASSLVLSLAAPVLAEVTADDAQAAYARLNYYGIAEGILREDGTKDPALDENLTRAQLVAMIVKAFGQKEYAEMLAGAQTFSDVPTSHWASGYLAIAKNIAAQNGNTIGYPDGTFGPENNVTAIEALAFVLKFLGVQVPGGDNWVEATIAAAKNAGVITDADVEKYLANPNEPATRGLAFAMADSIFYNYNGLDGKSVYTKYRDTEAPVVSLDAAPATTEKATIEITGKVSGDYREVYVGSDAITVAEDGTFSAQVKLDLGTNTIEVSAKDWAGNVGSAKLVIERVAGQAAKIQIVAPEGPVVAGSTIDLPVLVVDAEGADTGLTDVKVDAGEAGTWAEGKLTAATKAGKYTITASYEGLETATVEIEIVAGPLAKVEAETKSVKPGTAVKLIGVDQYGNKVEGVTFAEAEDYANAFIEGDQFIATKPGTYKVIGTKGEGEEAVKAEGTVSVFGDLAGFDISVDSELVANGSSQYTVTVTAVDKDGNHVTDFDGKVEIELTDLDLVASSRPKDDKAVDGVYTFKVTAPVGSEGLEAEIKAVHKNSDGDVIAEGSKTFEIVAQVATSIDLTADEYLAVNGPAFNGKVRILDQVGKPLRSGDSVEVKLSINGPAYFRGTDKEMTLDVSGDYLTYPLQPVDKYTEGTVTITATAEGLTSASKEVKAVYGLAAKDLVISAADSDPVKANHDAFFKFELSFVDKNGVPVNFTPEKDTEITLTFDSSKADDHIKVYVEVDPVDPANPVTNGLATVSDGKAKYELKADQTYTSIPVWVSAGAITGDVKVTASASGLGSGSGTISFKASDVAQITFEQGKADAAGFQSISVLANTEYTLTAVLKDGSGNVVPKAGTKVSFKPAANAKKYIKLNGAVLADNKDALDVETDAEGKASVKIAVMPYLTSGTYDITVSSGSLSKEAKLSIVPSMARSISVTTWVYDESAGWTQKTSYQAGDRLIVVANVKDNNGVTWADINLGRLELSGHGSSPKEFDGYASNVFGTAVPGETAPDNVSGFYVGPITITKAGNYTLKVKEATAISDVSGSRNIRVLPAEQFGVAYGDAKVTASSDPDPGYFKDATFSYTPGKVKEFVLNVVDEFGNKLAGSQVERAATTYALVFNAGDAGYADIRETESGGGSGEYILKVEYPKNTYRVYVVAGSYNTTAPQLEIWTFTDVNDDGKIDTSELGTLIQVIKFSK